MVNEASKKLMDRHDKKLLAKWRDGGEPNLKPSQHTLSPVERKLKRRMEKDVERFFKGR